MYQTSSKNSYDPEMGMGGYGKVGEDHMGGGYADFMEKQVRQGFIRKVFSILAVQLFITFGAAIGISSSAGLKSYLVHNSWPFWVAIPALVGSMVGLLCCGDMHRRFPHNYMLLGLFTLAESYLVGTTTIMYDTQTVLLAVAMTGGITCALVMYAFQTKYDFTTAGGCLLSFLMAFMIASIVMCFVPYSKAANVIFSACGAMLFSCYIVYDVQLLMDGKRVQLSPDDYVLAALNLYLDILNLFLYILSMLNDR
mmetsp:Transcript_10678/g.27373  ORF Transcript_10678/g.27373 Transcript_10678/m.27373 type:complete len:253 (-) Transcript_10678:117-875(-)